MILLFGKKAIIPASLILVFDIAFVLALTAIFSNNVKKLLVTVPNQFAVSSFDLKESHLTS